MCVGFPKLAHTVKVLPSSSRTPAPIQPVLLLHFLLSISLLPPFPSPIPQFTMDPCPFHRILISNLSLRLPLNPHLPPSSYYCKLKFKPFPNQFADLSVQSSESDSLDSRINACFSLSKPELEKLADKSAGSSSLKIEIHRRGAAGCGLRSGGKLVGCVAVQLDLREILDKMGKCVIHNGWTAVGGSDLRLHLNVRAEPDPRFVFLFDGEPECSPQVFQVNGNVKQPVFTCKFGLRSSSNERIMRSR